VTYRVDGANPVVGPPVFPGIVTVAGALIRIDGCTNANGFSTPSAYTITVSTPALAPGNYTVEYWRAFCDNNGRAVTAPALRASLAFMVAFDAAAIPASTNWELALLAITLAVVGYRVHTKDG